MFATAFAFADRYNPSVERQKRLGNSHFYIELNPFASSLMNLVQWYTNVNNSPKGYNDMI